MTIASIKEWFETAKPEPTAEDTCAQIGACLEDINWIIKDAGGEIGLFYGVELISELYKEKDEECVCHINKFFCDEENRASFLGTLCDQIASAVGAAQFLGMDIEGALNELSKSMWSERDGKTSITDENGKIYMSDTFYMPEFEKFVGELPWKK